ncbi:ATPase [Rufibacter sp. DG15C]|uniref:SRPBCC domain-containing protein n=1 Tax=Rufibacter sp. DG15C TaxID=1379909 RepID=UPI00078DECC6|nr:SRPBCC domain-containing protein [Rufibacter sp. DG15C]AMM51615.1 ATPase [Rufibacter sp. DG15C]
MNKAILFNFEVKKENNLIKVERSFNAPNDLVWVAWTEAEILDQWWAPKPYKAVTKSMDFREGGRWHYYMLSPEGEKHWCLFDYKKIQPLVYFSGIDAFCDEYAVVSTAHPRVEWENSFTAEGDSTMVRATLRFEKLEDLETIIQMGFKEGFTAGLENLDQYIATQFYLRKQNKTSKRARVTAYINLPGNTEEAFTFYKSVFKTEFVNGIKRFGEIPTTPGQPPIAEEVKKMVLHVELPLLGDFVLMGTDAPKEMGFTLTTGNNMHISLEPESLEEATRLFKELSIEGEIEMPLQKMFYGAYYAGFTDKYGINWMINYQDN